MTENINTLLGILVILGQIASIISIVFLISKKENTFKKDLFKFINLNALWIIFTVSLLATLGSLYYSDIAMYNPCKFCWFQRIFFYPQVFLLGLAIWKKDRKILDYSLMLSIIGFLIALNHYSLQMTGTSVLPCSTIGQNSTSCSSIFVHVFDYITIPLMALTGFAMNIVVAIIGKKEIK